MLSRLTFKNFRALADVDVELERLTVLVGPNACGKTSVLHGARLLGAMGVVQGDEASSTLHRAGKVFSGENGVGRLRTMGVTNGSIEIGGFRPNGHALSVVAHAGAREGVSVEQNTSFELRLSTDGGKTAAMTLKLPDGQPLEAQRFFESPALRGLANTVFVSLDPRRLAEPSYGEGLVPQIGTDGANLPSVLAHLAATDPARKAAIEASLQKVIPAAHHVALPRAGIARREVEILRINNEALSRPTERRVWGNRLQVEMRGAGFVDADLLSEGTLLTLALLTILETLDGDALVLIDDFEKGLHPKAQEDLVACLRRVLAEKPGVRILCTCHSPYVIDAFEPDEVRLMNTNAAGHAVIKRLTDHPEWPTWNGRLRTGEFWSTVGEGWVTDSREPGPAIGAAPDVGDEPRRAHGA